MSSADAPPPKRQRTEDVSVTRSDIWYPDGSVILQAQDTQFRVHWSLLAQSSSFFRDMQALPQPPDQPSVEGCPVIELHDAVADVKNLLVVLYTPMFPSEQTTEFDIVSALVRLGRKYEFRKLLDWAVGIVMSAIPTRLPDYLSMQFPGKNLIDYNGIELEILTLARENDILSALPCAYYFVASSYPQKDLFQGVSKDGGDQRLSLASIDLQRCILGRQALLSTQNKPGYTFGWLPSWVPSPKCNNPADCKIRRDAEICHRWTKSDVVRGFDYATPSRPFCPACTQQTSALIEAGKRKLWEDLPSFFDLPPWDELKNNP
ncbi:hypothetical protein C8F04DRAFT_1073072 [Mycena alexandri]|uniref:BTB domain-containing protein n=1 Tax=Mycena alexandri TaxID=1745969 RepID=A0AAD6XD80_9AGAR|nr:hypothetical protein C8F04DRAFT_1073072 [Mycena alexandri]